MSWTLDGLRGGVFSFSIIASGASDGGKGLTELLSITPKKIENSETFIISKITKQKKNYRYM